MDQQWEAAHLDHDMFYAVLPGKLKEKGIFQNIPPILDQTSTVGSRVILMIFSVFLKFTMWKHGQIAKQALKIIFLIIDA